MVAEGRALRELHEHVTVKVPFCEAGLEATHALTSDGIPVNMTLVFSANQAMLAAGAGATYVSCFMGRLDDISVDSGAVVAEIVDCFRAGGVTSRDHRRLDPPPRARGHRRPARLRDRDGAGARCCSQMLEHPLTTAGAEQFRADWQSRPEFGEWLAGLVERSPTSTSR